MGNSKFVDKFAELAGRLGAEVHLRSLRDAFATMMPVYILAGIAVLLNNTVFTWIFSGETLTNVQYWGTAIINGTLNVSGIIVAPLIGYYLAKNKGFTNPLASAIIAICSLIIMMPNVLTTTPVGGDTTVSISGMLAFSNIGTNAMFAGIICGLVFSGLFIRVSQIKKLQLNLGENIPPAVGASFSVLFPVIIILGGAAIISTLLEVCLHTNLITLITNIIQEPLRHVSTGLVGCCILYALGNLLWIFGIHQVVIYGSILEPLLIINMNQNMQAYITGQAIPNIINVSQVTTFALLGGSGCTLCLLIAILIKSKDKAARNVAKLSIGPGIFNINEPVIFGYPIVYNITMLIPFVLVPAVGIIISYLATSMGLMNYCVVQTPWTTPAILNAFFATAGDWRAIIVQLIIIVVGVLIYLPFVKINDKVVAKQAQLQEQEKNNL